MLATAMTLAGRPARAGQRIRRRVTGRGDAVLLGGNVARCTSLCRRTASAHLDRLHLRWNAGLVSLPSFQLPSPRRPALRQPGFPVPILPPPHLPLTTVETARPSPRPGPTSAGEARRSAGHRRSAPTQAPGNAPVDLHPQGCGHHQHPDIVGTRVSRKKGTAMALTEMERRAGKGRTS